jgi:hypothetical protein
MTEPLTHLRFRLCTTLQSASGFATKVRGVCHLKQAANQRIAPVQSEHDRDASHRQRHTACDRTMRSDAGDRPAHEARQRGHAQRRVDEVGLPSGITVEEERLPV